MLLCKPLLTSSSAGTRTAHGITLARDFTNIRERYLNRLLGRDGWNMYIQTTKNRVLRDGCIAYSRAKATSATIVFEARTRIIAGFARVQYRFEMRTARSSGGMAPVPISTTARCSNNPFGRMRLNWKEWLKAEQPL